MMDSIYQQWRDALLTEIPNEKLSAPIADTHSQWEWLDSEMVKLGSLNHQQLDLIKVQNVALELLRNESKDIRLVTHLLRTLQHAIDVSEVIRSIKLLNDYVFAFWESSWPAEHKKKARFIEPILKRYISIWPKFLSVSNYEQQLTGYHSLNILQQTWREMGHDNLASLLQTIAHEPELIESSEPDNNKALNSSEKDPTVSTLPRVSELGTSTAVQSRTIEVPQFIWDVTDEKQWKQSQLQLSELLCRQNPNNPIGYRLRRNAIWGNISSAPIADSTGKTPLAAMPIDIVDEYRSEFSTPSIGLLNKVEHSLSLSPYWFDGHYLAAKIAENLDIQVVADAIRQELFYFLARLPELRSFCFTDKTPFISDLTSSWLKSYSQNISPQNSNETNLLNVNVSDLTVDPLAIDPLTIDSEYENSLDNILAEMEKVGSFSIRNQSLQQLKFASMLEQKGHVNMALQQYRSVYAVLSSTNLLEWEADIATFLVSRLSVSDDRK